MSIRNLVQNYGWREHLNAFGLQMESVKSCFYVFNLNLGCKLIALAESLLGLWQLYQGGKQIAGHDTSLAPDWLDTPTTQHNGQVLLFVGLVGIFCSQLLLAGVVLQRRVCVLLWICVTVFCTLAFMFYALVFDCVPDLMLFDVLISVLRGYFVVVGVAYYFQMLRLSIGDDEDFEVLYSASEA